MRRIDDDNDDNVGDADNDVWVMTLIIMVGVRMMMMI